MEFLARWPAAHRRGIGTPRGSRALGPFRQAAPAAQAPDLHEELDLCRAQFLAAPGGTRLWVSDVEPGSTPDITSARIHVLPALYTEEPAPRMR